MIPYSVRDRKINVNEISGIDLLNALDNELLMKNPSNQIEGGHVSTVSTSILGTDTNYLNIYSSDDTTPITTIASETDSTNYKMHLYPKSLIANPSQNAMSIVNNPANNEVRVGINITSPQESLEVDGSIQIDSANVARLKFEKSGGSPHALGEIDGEEDGTNGGDLQFYTKLDGGSVTEKLRINNIGAIGIGGANFGTQGQILTSNGPGSAVSWQNGGTTYTAGTGVSISPSNEISIGQSVGTGDSPTFTQINSVYDYASEVVNGNQMSELNKFITAPHVKIGITLNSSDQQLNSDNPHSGNQDGGNSRVDVLSKFITFNAAGLGYTSTQFGHAFFTTGSGEFQNIRLNNVNIHTGTSDDRIKFNETRVTDGLDVINQINIYTYDKVYEIGHTPQNNPYRREIGVIAQEIQQIPQLASCVSVNEASPDSAERFPNGVPLSVYYDQIHSYHIRATQELHQIVQQQAQTIANLEARLVALEIN